MHKNWIAFFIICVFSGSCVLVAELSKGGESFKPALKVDSTFYARVDDSLMVNYKTLFILKAFCDRRPGQKKVVTSVSIFNMGIDGFYIDSLNVDQYSSVNTHTILYGPDIDCDLPMFFFLLPRKEQVTISMMLPEDGIDSLNINLCGTISLMTLRNEVDGKLDTISAGTSKLFRLKYDCSVVPKHNLFQIEMSKIPVKTMNGLTEIRVRGL